MLVEKVTLGADIEVFLKDRTTDEIVTAEGIIKGTKDVPYIFDKENRYFATSLDNVMAEFCIPPATRPSEFYDAIQKALRYINGTIPGHLTTYASAAEEIDEKYLQTENAQLFGCEPDYNAWTDLKNNPPGTSTRLRTCGGHIHIGYDMSDHMINLMLIKAMDIFVGLPSLILEPDNLRKTMYGKAGAFRDKNYGVEYRTISNFYLNDKSLTDWVFNNTLAAIEFVNNGGANDLGVEEKESIVNAINYNDKDVAIQLITKYNVKLAA